MNNKMVILEKNKLDKLREYLNSEEYVQFESAIKDVEHKNVEYFNILSNYYYLLGKYELGIEILEETIIKFPFSSDIHYNLGILQVANGDFEKALLTLSKCLKLTDESDELFKEIELQFNQLIEYIQNSIENSLSEKKEILSLVENTLKSTNEKCYPIDSNGRSLIRKVISDTVGNQYITQLYGANFITDVDGNSRYFFKTELMPGEIIRGWEFDLKDEAVVPLSFIENFTEITINNKNDDKIKYHFKSNELTFNQLNYIKLEGNCNYTIQANEEIFIGKPISLKDNKKNPQIILNIFIDGLAQTVLEEELENLMPNTYKFFNDGYINKNCYTTGDWTLPSVAAIYTGKTTLNHNIYHPDLDCKVNEHSRLFTSDFKKNGYFTSQINNDWRITPTYGYLEDMDRILYQNYTGGYTVGNVVADTIEQLETFKEKNHFMWMSIMDLHDVADGIDNDLMTQVNTDAVYRQNKEIGVTSVLSSYDFNKIKKYEAELKRIDIHLAGLYNYLEREFGKENIIVSLISDHGQTYLKQDEFLLHEPKRKVPFMMVGHDIPKKVSYEISSIIDIFPTIAKLANVEMDSQEGRVLKDFGGKGREFALTETLHPNQPYLVAITDDQHIFRFQTEAKTNYSGLIDLTEFTVQLLDKGTLEDVTNNYQDKVGNYIKWVISRAIQVQI